MLPILYWIVSASRIRPTDDIFTKYREEGARNWKVWYFQKGTALTWSLFEHPITAQLIFLFKNFGKIVWRNNVFIHLNIVQSQSSAGTNTVCGKILLHFKMRNFIPAKKITKLKWNKITIELMQRRWIFFC